MLFFNKVITKSIFGGVFFIFDDVFGHNCAERENILKKKPCTTQSESKCFKLRYL